MENKKMDLQRSLIAYKTLQSWKKVPHVTYVYEPDVTDFYLEYRKLKNQFLQQDIRLTMNTLMIKTAVEGIKAAPILNSMCEFKEDTLEGILETREHINVGIPWILENGGMITLTAFELENKSLEQIAREIEDIGERLNHTDIADLFERAAKDERPYGSGMQRIISDKLEPEDIMGSTVTVSNIGSVSRVSGYFALLDILAPQVFTLGISAMTEKPGVYTDADGNKQIGIRKIMPLCLAFDHKALDFGDLTPFIDRLEDIFKHPEQMHNW